jgi:hypothetical protein
MNITLLRGILVHGTVVEAGNGQPVAAAAINHEWSGTNNPFYLETMKRRENIWPTRGAVTGPDGRFSIVVPPGPGFLVVKAAEPDYVHIETSTGRLDGGRGGTPVFPDGLFPLAPGPNDPPLNCVLSLTRGVPLRGEVIDSDGKPAASAVIVAPTYIPEGIELKGHALQVRDGHFEIPGCDPRANVLAVVYDRRTKRGAMVELSPGASTPPTVRLAPAVAARVTLVGPAAMASAQPRLTVELLFRAGPQSSETFTTGEPAALGVDTQRVFGAENAPLRHQRGEFVLPNLIPGAPYSVRVDLAGFHPGRVTFHAPPPGSQEPVEVVIRPMPIERPKR